jgi:hypothetical protein
MLIKTEGNVFVVSLDSCLLSVDILSLFSNLKRLNKSTNNSQNSSQMRSLRVRHLPNDWETVLDKTKKMLLQLGQHNTLQLPDYKNIITECLLLLGDQDKMVTVDETIAVQKALPNAGFKLLPGTPHPIEQVHATMLASIITDFI